MENNDEELVPVKLSDILRASRKGNEGAKYKQVNQRRINNRLARRNRRKNLRNGHVGGRQ